MPIRNPTFKILTLYLPSFMQLSSLPAIYSYLIFYWDQIISFSTETTLMLAISFRTRTLSNSGKSVSLSSLFHKQKVTFSLVTFFTLYCSAILVARSSRYIHRSIFSSNSFSVASFSVTN